jgi:hypothetical protein
MNEQVFARLRLALRVATLGWLAASAIQFVVWLLIVVLGGDMVAPWWLWTVGAGGALVGAGWLAVRTTPDQSLSNDRETR